SLFIVPADAPGLGKHPLPVDLLLPERQFTLHFDDVRVGPGALVGEEGAGFRQVFHGLNPERITGAALGVGIARYVLGAAARYASERKVWSDPIGTHQGVSHPLARARIETELAALMTRRAAWQHDHGEPAGESSNMAKYAAAEAALAAVDAAIQAHGGNGLSSEYGLMPYWGLARLLRIAPVNREMILNYVAQHSLGLPRSYYQEQPWTSRVTSSAGSTSVTASPAPPRADRISSPWWTAIAAWPTRNSTATSTGWHTAWPAWGTSAATRSRWPPATAPTSSPSTTRAPSSAWSACPSIWAGGRTRWPMCSATRKPAASWSSPSSSPRCKTPWPRRPRSPT